MRDYFFSFEAKTQRCVVIFFNISHTYVIYVTASIFCLKSIVSWGAVFWRDIAMPQDGYLFYLISVEALKDNFLFYWIFTFINPFLETGGIFLIYWVRYHRTRIYWKV